MESVDTREVPMSTVEEIAAAAGETRETGPIGTGWRRLSRREADDLNGVASLRRE